MWQTKVFKTLEDMRVWIDRNNSRTEWHEIYINNAYGVEYRYLTVI